MIKRLNDKIYEQYKVENTDYIVEVCEEENNYIGVWLYKQGYGVKSYMFGIEKCEDYIKIIQANVLEHISFYEEEYVNE